MDEEPVQLQQPWAILCEGHSDKHVIRALLAARGIEGFDITFPSEAGEGGKDRFETGLSGLKAVSKPTMFQGIVIIADNDSDPDRAFKDVQEQIENAEGYRVPDRPYSTPNLAHAPAVVVMMLPKEGEPGCLEHLCLQAGYAKWPDMRVCLERFLQCAPARDWPNSRKAKMLLRCLISATCQSDPNVGLRYLWSDRRRECQFSLAHACFDPISDYLRSLRAGPSSS